MTSSKVASTRSASVSLSSTPETRLDGGSRSSRWKCPTPRKRPVGRLQRRSADVDHRREGRAELGLADLRQRVGDGGVRRQDDRVGCHQPTGGALLVGEQPSYVAGFVGFHQGQQLLGRLGRQLGDEVGSVVRRHLLEHVRCPLGRELAQDLDLVVLGKLFQYVGEALVVERAGHLCPTFR